MIDSPKYLSRDELQAEAVLLRTENAALKAELAEVKGVKDLWEKTAKSLGAELDELKAQEPRLMMNGVGNTEAVLKDQPQSLGFTISLFTAPQPAVPAGWKLVPVEATEDMLAAWQKHFGTIQGAYKAMLAAAPEAPQAHSTNPSQD